MPGEVILSIENVAVHFGGLVAISDLNCTVCDGEIVGLIGPNGAGKTTAFNVFTGFLRPTSGEVRYRGTLLNGLKPHEIADLGLVRTFQRTSVFQNNSVYENVLIGLHRRGRSTPCRICSSATTETVRSPTSPRRPDCTYRVGRATTGVSTTWAAR